MYASDVEPSDVSNATTDDEFFNELVNAPAEFEDCLIPDQCKNETEGLEHLVKCLNRRFTAYPAVFMGTLKEAIKEAFCQKQITERRPLLIYVNNDKSIYTNLFCKQLLCNEDVIEYLMNNYVLWAWDITYESNGQKLNDMCKVVFAPWTNDKQFNLTAIDQYPSLVGVDRDLNGDYRFNYLIQGPNKKPNREEFLGSLKDFKGKFETSEQQLEKAKEEAKQQMLLNLFQSRDIQRRSKYHDREFFRSVSVFHPRDLEGDPNIRQAQFTRLLSNDSGMRRDLTNPMSREDFMRALETFRIDPDDADDEDDEPTPTVERPAPKFT